MPFETLEQFGQLVSLEGVHCLRFVAVLFIRSRTLNVAGRISLDHKCPCGLGQGIAQKPMDMQNSALTQPAGGLGFGRVRRWP